MLDNEKDQRKQAMARMAFKHEQDWIQRRPSSVFQQHWQSENRRDDTEVQGYDVRGCNSILTEAVVAVLSAKHAMTPLPVSPISSGSDIYLTRAVNNTVGAAFQFTRMASLTLRRFQLGGAAFTSSLEVDLGQRP
jgi:hypothetical protein